MTRALLALGSNLGDRVRYLQDAVAMLPDVDAVSRATITVRAAAREIRDSARMVARAVLSPAAVGR